MIAHSHTNWYVWHYVIINTTWYIVHVWTVGDVYYVPCFFLCTYILCKVISGKVYPGMITIRSIRSATLT